MKKKEICHKLREYMQRICDDDDDDRRPNPTSHKERSIPFIRLLLKEHRFLILIQSNSEWKTLYPITEHVNIIQLLF